MKDYVESKLGEGLTEVFAEWAFGEDYRDMAISTMNDVFNKNHPDGPTIPDGMIRTEGIDKMIDYWEQQAVV
jgi:hypothetical protein